MSNARDKANIPSLNFSSTGIDDNATSTAITIDSIERVGIGTSNPTSLLHLKANAPYITFEDDDNNQDWQIQATAWFAFRNQTTNSELMRIDSSGRLNIGTSTSISGSLLNIDGGFINADVTNNSHKFIRSTTNTTGLSDPLLCKVKTTGDMVDGLAPVITFAVEDSSGVNNSLGFIGATRSGADNSGSLIFHTFNSGSQAERMRIDPSGNLIVGGTSSSINNVGAKMTVSGGFQATKSSSASLSLNRISTDGDIAEFRHIGTVVGSISVTSSATSYNTTSDKRLKDNIQTITDGTEKVMAMNAVTHTWKDKPDTKPVHGFIAQEMQQIIPEAVNGNPDSEEMMSMDYGRITPLLVASLQDAHKKIKELQNKINNMENK